MCSSASVASTTASPAQACTEVRMAEPVPEKFRHHKLDTAVHTAALPAQPDQILRRHISDEAMRQAWSLVSTVKDKVTCRR